MASKPQKTRRSKDLSFRNLRGRDQGQDQVHKRIQRVISLRASHRPLQSCLIRSKASETTFVNDYDSSQTKLDPQEVDRVHQHHARKRQGFTENTPTENYTNTRIRPESGVQEYLEQQAHQSSRRRKHHTRRSVRGKTRKKSDISCPKQGDLI